MTIEEYKTLYPIAAVFIQIDDTKRNMTLEEYDEWVKDCVEEINNAPVLPK
jgi:hypothetical protein